MHWVMGTLKNFMKCLRPFIAALLDNLEERFLEDSVALMDAVDVFDPINAASSSSSEARYKYGHNEISIRLNTTS